VSALNHLYHEFFRILWDNYQTSASALLIVPKLSTFDIRQIYIPVMMWPER
jgi:hypothetical protein